MYTRAFVLMSEALVEPDDYWKIAEALSQRTGGEHVLARRDCCAAAGALAPLCDRPIAVSIANPRFWCSRLAAANGTEYLHSRH